MPEAGARRRSRRSSPEAAAPQPPKRWAPWVLPLVAGLAFGSGYGITDRLLALQAGGPLKLDQGFDVKPFPGTTLESLRLRYGADREELRGDLELIELERQQQEAAAKAKREAAENAAQKPAAGGAPDGPTAESTADTDSAADAPSPEPVPEPGPPALDVPPPPAPEGQP